MVNNADGHDTPTGGMTPKMASIPLSLVRTRSVPDRRTFGIGTSGRPR
ncbi:hypothetical protein ACFQ1L_34585 [Phytohabitans flavus]|nr:hypothetical protein [Phytohabitans flavus]